MIDIPDAILTFPHLKIQNVNAISSPLTWGFPCITAILGFVHALERNLRKTYDIKLNGVGVVCHNFSPQIFKSNNKINFCLTRNPDKIEKSSGETKPSSFSIEGKAHIELSLIIKVYGQNCCVLGSEAQDMADKMFSTAQLLRIAGGNILPEMNSKKKPKLEIWPDNYEEQEKISKKILKNLVPGFALICRRDLLEEKTKLMQAINSDATIIDAFIEYSRCSFNTSATENSVELKIPKKTGWIVPISTGYIALSEIYAAGHIPAARDNNYPFRFVENIYSLGQWCSPLRLNRLEDIMWNYHVDLNKGLYRCINNNLFNAK